MSSPKAIQRSKGRLAVRLAQEKSLGTSTLVISDENLIGPLRSNLRCASLYPEIGLRMARVGSAFGTRISTISVQIRALDMYWSSVLAFMVARGFAVPDPKTLDRLAHNPRSWRSVIVELSCAVPDVKIVVTPFEQFVQRPDLVLGQIAQTSAPKPPNSGIWTNRSLALPQLRSIVTETDPRQLDALPNTDGRWHPFSTHQRHTLRARHIADLDWFRAGADGLATYQEYPTPAYTDQVDLARRKTRGSEDYDSPERRMARHC